MFFAVYCCAFGQLAVAVDHAYAREFAREGGGEIQLHSYV